jgi:hypothetical protein
MIELEEFKLKDKTKKFWKKLENIFIEIIQVMYIQSVFQLMQIENIVINVKKTLFLII